MTAVLITIFYIIPAILSFKLARIYYDEEIGAAIYDGETPSWVDVIIILLPIFNIIYPIVGFRKCYNSTERQKRKERLNKIPNLLFKPRSKYKLPKHNMVEITNGIWAIHFRDFIEDDVIEEINNTMIKKYDLLDKEQIDWKNRWTVWIHPLTK